MHAHCLSNSCTPPWIKLFYLLNISFVTKNSTSTQPMHIACYIHTPYSIFYTPSSIPLKKTYPSYSLYHYFKTLITYIHTILPPYHFFVFFPPTNSSSCESRLSLVATKQPHIEVPRFSYSSRLLKMLSSTTFFFVFAIPR